MIKEFIFYFLLIFGFFCFVETLFNCIISKRLPEDIYLITMYNNKEDREKITYLAKTYNFRIYVISPSYYDTDEAFYITDRYYNVKFIKDYEEIEKDGRKTNCHNRNS